MNPHPSNLRQLPAVHRLLDAPGLAPYARRLGPGAVKTAVAGVLDAVRREVGGPGADIAGDSAADVPAYGVLLEGSAIADVVLPTDVENLWIVPATLRLAGAEVELVGIDRREQRLKEALRPALDAYDYILIDCPPSLGLLTVNALTAAREILIPVQAEYYALEGLSQLTTIVEHVRADLNPTLEIFGVLITMFDGRTRLAIEVLDEVHRFFPERVFHTQIPRNIRLSEAPSYGKPVVLFDPKSRGAQAYIQLARETLGGIGSVEALL